VQPAYREAPEPAPVDVTQNIPVPAAVVPVSPAPAFAAAVSTAPAPIPAPIPAPAPIQVSEESLRQSLDAVGLQWVQTDPGKTAAEAAPEPAPKLGRAPRKNTETAPQEPLVMVETRQNNP
jgi:ribonuclease E